ncbi:MAG: hypothetical protein ACK4GD_08970 [Sphingomonadaceae bacterium]
MGLSCDQTQAFVLVTLVRSIGSGMAAGALVVDGTSYPVTFNVVGQPSRLFGPVADQKLITALAGGKNVAITVNGKAIGTLPLTGSSQALSQALSGCWQNPAAARPVAQAEVVALQFGDGPPPIVSPTDRTAIMRSAGFSQRRGKWTACEGEETGDIAALQDLNGDGQPEALVMSYGTACRGFTGSGFALLTRAGGIWEVVAESTGIPSLYRNDASGWPDIEIGGPGTDCFPLLRWDGTRYMRAGTSLSGNICTLEPQFAASPVSAATPLPAQTPAAGPAGILGQVPVRLGYYVRMGAKCAAPTYLYKFERSRHLEIVPEKNRVDVLVYKYGGVISQKDGAYQISIANPGPEDFPSLGIRPMGGGGLDLLYQGTTSLIHCPDEQIPARLRR